MKQEGGSVAWTASLKPGASRLLRVAIPSITLSQEADIELLRKLNFDAEAKRVCAFWRGITAQGTQIQTPEPWINDFYKAHVRHLLINCFKELDTEYLHAHVGTFHYGVYPSESVMMISDLDRRGYHDQARRNYDAFLHYQGTVALPGNFKSSEGEFYGVGGHETGGYNKSHGYVMWGMAEHWWYTRDRDWMEKAAPGMVKACEWVIRERQGTMTPDQKTEGRDRRQRPPPTSVLRLLSSVLEYGWLPAGSLEDVTDYWNWLATNSATVWGFRNLADALADFGHPEGKRLQQEAQAFYDDFMRGITESRILCPVVRLRDGTYVPKIPSRPQERGRAYGWIREVLEGSMFLPAYGLLAPTAPETRWILKDYEDNLYISDRYGYSIPSYDAFWFSRGGFSMQANLLDGPLPYLWRDDVKHYLRAYFNGLRLGVLSRDSPVQRALAAGVGHSGGRPLQDLRRGPVQLLAATDVRQRRAGPGPLPGPGDPSLLACERQPDRHRAGGHALRPAVPALRIPGGPGERQSHARSARSERASNNLSPHPPPADQAAQERAAEWPTLRQARPGQGVDRSAGLAPRPAGDRGVVPIDPIAKEEDRMYAVKIAVASVLLLSASARAMDASAWTVYVTNDNCPDYTWGLTEEQTRQAFADIVRAHLDEMNRTDGWEPANQDHYNMAVTQEAMCFVERYPERQAELIRRIKEGRVLVSPFLCNSLWAFHSTEGAIRVLYPARRLERDWGIAIDVAEHIEDPSLPWGMAPILAGAGIRWLSVPFYHYDSTFQQLKNPPLFIWEGPDGSRLRVILDPWASNRASYTQGAAILKKPESIEKEWLPHYDGLGNTYSRRAILASGTHGDIAPRSGDQAHGFAEAIRSYNAGSGPHPKLINATVGQFCAAVDQEQGQRPFLPTVSGCFGHSWDLWPVSLAKYVADMRQAERDYLAAETLLAVAAWDRPDLRDATRKRPRAGRMVLGHAQRPRAGTAPTSRTSG